MQTQRDNTKYCTKCGNELETEADIKICPHCGKRYYFNPKPCVALWLTKPNGEVLLTKRAREPFKDWWDIPGGFVEEHETLEDAILRELKEETGLEITEEALKYAGSFYQDYHFGGEIVPVVAAVYRGKVGADQTITVADDVSDYKFVPTDEIDFDTIAFEQQRAFLQKLR